MFEHFSFSNMLWNAINLETHLLRKQKTCGFLEHSKIAEHALKCSLPKALKKDIPQNISPKQHKHIQTYVQQLVYSKPKIVLILYIQYLTPWSNQYHSPRANEKTG